MVNMPPGGSPRPVWLDDKTKSIMDRAIAREQSLSRLLMTYIVTGLIFMLTIEITANLFGLKTKCHGPSQTSLVHESNHDKQSITKIRPTRCRIAFINAPAPNR